MCARHIHWRGRPSWGAQWVRQRSVRLFSKLITCLMCLNCLYCLYCACTLWCLYMWILRTGYGNIKGSARFANPSSGRGELIVSFNPCNVCLNIDFTDFIDFNFLPLSIVGRKKRSLFGDGTQQANYKVVKTDYTSYSVVYNCNPIGNILKKGKNKNNSSKESLFLKWSEYDFWF